MKKIILLLWLALELGLTSLEGQNFGSSDNEEVIVTWSSISGFQGTIEKWKVVFHYGEHSVRARAYSLSQDPFGNGELVYDFDVTATDLLAWNGALEALEANQTNLIAQFATDRFLELSFEFKKKESDSYKRSFSVVGVGIFTTEFLQRMDRTSPDR